MELMRAVLDALKIEYAIFDSGPRPWSHYAKVAEHYDKSLRMVRKIQEGDVRHNGASAQILKRLRKTKTRVKEANDHIQLKALKRQVAKRPRFYHTTGR